MGLEPPAAEPAAPYRPPPPLDRRAHARALLDELSGRPLAVALVVLVVLAAGAAAWWWSTSGGSAPPVEEVLPHAGQADGGAAGAASAAGLPETTTGASASTTPGAGAGELVVHAAGAVVRPGVYHLAAGARVADLVEAAGGLATDADGDRVNLALPLADGERVYVPAVGQAEVPVVPGGAGGGGGTGGGAGADGGGVATAPVDVNVASQAELEALPGVGPVTARAIIDHREQHGPFAAVDDLLDVRGIGEARLADLRDLVVV